MQKHKKYDNNRKKTVETIVLIVTVYQLTSIESTPLLFCAAS